MPRLPRRHVLKTGAGAFAAALAAPAMAQSTQSQSTLSHRVPAEEAPHQATFMQWPVTREVYADRIFRRQVQGTIVEVANTIAAFEPVILLASGDLHDQLARRLSENVTLWDIPTDDLWARDAGPLFTRLADGSLGVSRIQFNGWGNRQGHDNDGLIAARVAERLGLPLIDSGLVGEPGGVEADGHGLLMAHASSWVQENRNPGMSEAEIGEALMAAYGADRIIWAPGVAGLDITDYHIDSLARFTGPGRVLMNLPDAPDWDDPYQVASYETHDILVAAGLDVDVIPDPTQVRSNYRDFVAAYVNYYVCNGAVIAAQFGDPETDAIAGAALARHYPSREVVMLNADPLGELGGGIHCATQQMPAA